MSDHPPDPVTLDPVTPPTGTLVRPTALPRPARRRLLATLRKGNPGQPAGATPHSAPSTPDPDVVLPSGAADEAFTVPVSGLSIWDPIYLGIDEYGRPVYLYLVYRNLLIGGLSGYGKSVALNNIAAHAFLATDVQVVCIDGKEVELGMWRHLAEVFVGPDPIAANHLLAALQGDMNDRYAFLTHHRRKHITRADGFPIVAVLIDEVAYFSATAGDKTSQDEFVALLRDLVARGRAAGIIVIAATQRPSADIVPTSLRDIFAYRLAYRCATEASSDIILGTGYAKAGYNAMALTSPGIGYLLEEKTAPARFKTAYLSDGDIDELADRAAWIRGHHRTLALGADRAALDPATTGGGEAA